MQSASFALRPNTIAFCQYTKKGDTMALLNASSAASATAYKNELISYLYNGMNVIQRLYQREKPINKKATATVALPKQTIALTLNRKQGKRHHHHHPQCQQQRQQQHTEKRLCCCTLVWGSAGCEGAAHNAFKLQIFVYISMKICIK